MAVLQVFSGVTKTFSDEQTRAMNHVVENEINAIGTLCSIVMPSICPELTYHEEGIYIQDNIGVSPDGTLRKDGEVWFAVEVKCPTNSDETYTFPVHYEVPARYIIQCIFEARNTQSMKGTLYMSWATATSTIFIVPRCKDIEALAIEIYKDIFEAKVTRRPSRNTDKVMKMKAMVKEHVKKCTFILYNLCHVNFIWVQLGYAF